MAALTKSAAKQVALARTQLADNPGYYARSLSAMQRCGSVRQQRAIEVAIGDDNAWHLFAIGNGCLTASVSA